METIKFSRLGIEDLNVGTGTFEVTLADGRVVTLQQINGDLIPWESFKNVEEYASFAAAVTAIGGTATTLLVGTAQVISTAVTVPSTLHIKVIGSGSFTKSGSGTLTFNGPFEAPLRQVFSGFAAGDVTGLKKVHPEYWGAAGDGVTDDGAAINLAISHGGAIIFSGSATYLSSIALTALPDSASLQGEGTYQVGSTPLTKLKYTGSGNFITLSSRNRIQNLWIEGKASDSSDTSNFVGTGVIMGSVCQISNVRINFFQKGMRFPGVFWNEMRQVTTDYNVYGVDFEAATPNNANQFYTCRSMYNQRNGLVGLTVGARNIGIGWYGGSIEQNCSEDVTTYAQVALGSAGQVVFDGVYFEYATGTAPDIININGMTEFRIVNSYFNRARKAIVDVAAGSGRGVIGWNRFLSSVSADIDMASVTEVLAIGNNYSGAGVTLTGTNISNITGTLAQIISSELNVGSNLLLHTSGYMEATEISDPAAPDSNKGRLYIRDNGAGKTQLVVRFPTGAVQVIATEP